MDNSDGELHTPALVASSTSTLYLSTSSIDELPSAKDIIGNGTIEATVWGQCGVVLTIGSE